MSLQVRRLEVRDRAVWLTLFRPTSPSTRRACPRTSSRRFGASHEGGEGFHVALVAVDDAPIGRWAGAHPAPPLDLVVHLVLATGGPFRRSGATPERC